MKYLWIALLSLAVSLTSHAQQADVSLAVAMPAGNQLAGNTAAILKNKVLVLVSSAGIAGAEFGAFAVISEVNVTDQRTVEGGMRRIISVDVMTTLTVMNVITNVVFGTIQAGSTGDGYSEAEAMRSAINKLDLPSLLYVQFFSSIKEKIQTYYRDNMSALITKARVLASQQQYDEALALLTTYPESLQGYASVAQTMTEIFKQWQTSECSQVLMAARAAYAQRDFEKATFILSGIDATSSCASEAKALLNDIRQSNEKQYEDELLLAQEEMRAAERMQKEAIEADERIRTTQINAIKDIATSYFSRRTDIIFL